MPISLVGHSVLSTFRKSIRMRCYRSISKARFESPMMAQPMACRRVWVDCLCGGWRISRTVDCRSDGWRLGAW